MLYVTLFMYGLSTFISPCSVGLVSAYLTYTLKDNTDRRQGLLVGLSYVAAMSLVFFVFGFSLSSLIPVSLASSKLFYIFAGGLMFVLGVNNLGLLDWLKPLQSLFYRISSTSDNLQERMRPIIGGDNVFLGAFVFGIVISLALGPCSLAIVLPAVMMTLFSAPTAVHGGLQLLAFGVGHSVPVLLLSLLFTQSRIYLSKVLVKFGNILNRFFGVGLIILGIWLILGVF